MSKLKRYRMYKGIKRKELSEKTGITETTLYRIEKGVQNPSIIYALKIAKALNTKVEDIFEIKEKSP